MRIALSVFAVAVLATAFVPPRAALQHRSARRGVVVLDAGIKDRFAEAFPRTTNLLRKDRLVEAFPRTTNLLRRLRRRLPSRREDAAAPPATETEAAVAEVEVELGDEAAAREADARAKAAADRKSVV